MKYLPKAALGAWAWGNDGTFGNHYTASDLKEVYEAAMDNGLNLWDTAVVYGRGVSENILGELTKDTERKKLILSTIFCMENAADKLELSSVRYWEKIME